MKRILTVIFAFAIFAVTAVFAQPKLEIQGGDTYNWKDVKPNDSPLTADVILKNTGNEKLVISNVKPTCGCTTAPLDKTDLNPGESTTMHITLRIGSNSGPVSKTVNISTNDPDARRKVLWLKANVVREIEVGPNAYFTFDEMQVGTSKEVTFWVKNNSKKEVTLSNYEISPETVTISLAGPVKLGPGEKVDITVKATPDKKGYFNVRLIMKTSNEDYKTLKIDGFGKVKESPIFNND